MLLAALTTLGLAHWQWQRGQARQALLTRFSAQSGTERELLSWQIAARPDMSRVRFFARPLGSPLLLQNSSLEEGQVGVRVLQPYRLDDGSVVLGDRGWLQDGPHQVVPPAEPQWLRGRWLSAPHRFTLPGAIIGSSGRLDALDLTGLQQRLARPLRDGVVVLDTTVRPLVPWPARPDVNPAQNYAYALQWLLMSLGLTAATIRTVWRRRLAWAGIAYFRIGHTLCSPG